MTPPPLLFLFLSLSLSTSLSLVFSFAYVTLSEVVIIKSELIKHCLSPSFISRSLFFLQALCGPAVPASCSVFVTSVHGHSGKVSVKEWFILQQYCYRPREGDTSGVSAFLALGRKTLPPAEAPLPIEDLIQLENSIFLTEEWKWQTFICQLRSVYCSATFSQKRKFCYDIMQ